MLRKLVVLISLLAFPVSCAGQAAQCKTLYPKFDWRAYRKVAVVGVAMSTQN